MKVVKARYYETTNEIVPLDPQPVRNVDGTWDYQRAGSDEKGEFVVIDFISEEAHYFEYEANGDTISKDLKETTEEEWNKTETRDIESMDLILRSNAVSVDVSTLQELPTTNLKMNLPTSSTVTERLTSIIVRLFSSAYNAILKIFRS